MNFMASFIFFEQDKSHSNRGIEINLVDVTSTHVRSEEELSHSIHPHRQTNLMLSGFDIFLIFSFRVALKLCFLTFHGETMMSSL